MNEKVKTKEQKSLHKKENDKDMQIDKKLIEEIKNETSISQVIGSFIPLTKKGQNYVGICPFHDDHSPSLSVNEQKKLYKCFSCGAGGDVFTFVKEYTKCSYQEAVIKVAEMIGKPIEIENSEPKKESPYKHLHNTMADSISFATYALRSKQGIDAKEYLNKRGLTDDIIEYFDIGYIPKGNLLIEYLQKKGHSGTDILKTGLGREVQDNFNYDFEFYNVFGGRVVFPIHDNYGNPIAYTARSLEDSQSAKYINTAETEIFKKGRTVYNLHRAFREARHGIIYVCEGVMDVIALKRAGIDNAVATLGTACTKEQLNLIAKATDNVVFFYDGDKAGRDATMKAVELALEMGLNPSVVVNDTGKDPDEIANIYGKQALNDLVSKMINGIEYAFDYYKGIYQLDNYDGKKDYMDKVDALIDYLDDDYDRQNFKKELSNITGLPCKKKESFEDAINQIYVASEYLNRMIDTGLAETNTKLQEILAANRALHEKIDVFMPDEQKTQERRNMAERKEYVKITFRDWVLTKSYTTKDGVERVNIKIPAKSGEYDGVNRSFSVPKAKVKTDVEYDKLRYITLNPYQELTVSRSIKTVDEGGEVVWESDGKETWTPEEIKEAFTSNYKAWKKSQQETKKNEDKQEVETETEHAEERSL